WIQGLEIAARFAGVPMKEIQQVLDWDEGMESDTEDEADDFRMTTDDFEYPIPLPRVSEVYKQATPVLNLMAKDPTNDKLSQQLMQFNEKIRVDNVKEKLHEHDWQIPVEWFITHYGLIREARSRLQANPEDNQAKREIMAEESLIDKEIQLKHFPTQWSISAADEAWKKQQTTKIVYPWPTKVLPDGSVIIGVKRNGSQGRQVCVEIEEAGRTVRYLKPAYKVGLRAVDEYAKEQGKYKNLAEEQSKWSKENRNDIAELLWVTSSVVKGDPPKRDPVAYCCVRLYSGKLDILTRSSLCKVWGDKDAKTAIKKVCDRDQILTPWEAREASYSN
ncbi:uncharacterized protein B0I36DRAFT_217683, partial [Microdochium trichocladiopsis]